MHLYIPTGVANASKVTGPDDRDQQRDIEIEIEKKFGNSPSAFPDKATNQLGRVVQNPLANHISI